MQRRGPGGPDHSSGHTEPFFLGRPSWRAALGAILLCGLLTAGGAWLAAQQSPLAVRSVLPLLDAPVGDVYLTTLPEDPERVLLTTKRGNTTVRRADAQQAGSRYWIHRYGDPTRPEVSDRILLKSRKRGARLLLPVSALDLERSLARPVAEGGAPRELRAESELVHLYRDRLFQGLYLETRFPRRELLPDGLWRQFDLVTVRDRFVRTSDFTLHPNPRYYRARLAAGTAVVGPLRRMREASGDELVFALYEDPERTPVPLHLPFSLFDELALAWGDSVPTILDDRWHVDTYPAFETVPAPPATRALVARLVAMHLAARIENGAEPFLLMERVARFAGT